MVKVAVAGGSGGIGGEVVQVLLDDGTHDVTILTRKTASKGAARANSILSQNQNVKVQAVDYLETAELARVLKGTHSVLSFIINGADSDNTGQKSLIDACILAGVKRFAPAEWATKSNSPIPQYAGKADVREYLEYLNADHKVLEYTLFQPGFLLDFLTWPYPATRYMPVFPCLFSFEECRALLLESGSQYFGMTSAHDLGRVVAAALSVPDREGWPIDGSMYGDRLTAMEIVQLGERIRGRPFTISHVTQADLKKESLATDWVPIITHPSLPVESREMYSRKVPVELLNAADQGFWDVSDSWNKRLPQLKLSNAEGFPEESLGGQAMM